MINDSEKKLWYAPLKASTEMHVYSIYLIVVNVNKSVTITEILNYQGVLFLIPWNTCIVFVAMTTAI